MNYLDYLLTHTYEQLPATIRNEVTERDYSSRRSVALGLRARAVDLPPVLRQAYRRTVAVRPRARRRFYWVAAAGWLLAIAAGVLLLGHQPRLEYVARVSPPVIERDTVEVTRHDTVVRVVYRDRLLRDTFIAPAPAPTYLVVHDTVYRAPKVPYPVGTVAVDPAGLSLLVGSRGD
ncbi:hypothetical protein [Lewinella sp. IMCC34183]|uniref:hypothetical protein n=1 Tax=Lewinella sp. IMCC34183 TaxID=2248762 RepID=UPI000E25C8A1|nr:hypothetical protein [Lewinella sp. IMCC34183]